MARSSGSYLSTRPLLVREEISRSMEILSFDDLGEASSADVYSQSKSTRLTGLMNRL